MRALAILLALLMLTPAASAATPLLGPVVDSHIGEVRDRLETANATYGERQEFQTSRVELGRSGLALINNATLVSEDNLIKAVGALETGRLRAQARGSANPSEQVVDGARQIASQAESMVTQLRSDLKSMERTGLEPVALDGGVTVAHLTIRAMDLLRQYQIHLQRYESGEHGEQTETGVVSSAAGARLMARLAQDLMAEVAEARADAPVEPFLTSQELDDVVRDRVSWTQANAAPATRNSRERVIQIAEAGDRLLTLGAYLIWFQDLAFNGINTQIQQGSTEAPPYQTAWELHNASQPRVQAWVEETDVPGDLAIGGLGSAAFSLELNRNNTANRDQLGAYATSLVHLGVEHAGLLQQAYGGIEHDPGTELAAVDEPGSSGTDSLPTGWIIGLAGLALAALLAVGWRRRR